METTALSTKQFFPLSSQFLTTEHHPIEIHALLLEACQFFPPLRNKNIWGQKPKEFLHGDTIKRRDWIEKIQFVKSELTNSLKTLRSLVI